MAEPAKSDRLASAETEWPRGARLLRPAEVASLLAVSLKTAYRLCRSGELPSVAVGTNRRVRPEDLDSYVAAHRTATKKDAKALRNGGVRLEVSDPKYLK